MSDIRPADCGDPITEDEYRELRMDFGSDLGTYLAGFKHGHRRDRPAGDHAMTIRSGSIPRATVIVDNYQDREASNLPPEVKNAMRDLRDFAREVVDERDAALRARLNAAGARNEATYTGVLPEPTTTRPPHAVGDAWVGEPLATWTTDSGDLVKVNEDREVIVHCGRGHHAYDPEQLGLALIAAGTWAEEKAPVEALEVITAKRARNVPNGTLLIRTADGGRPLPGAVVIEKTPCFTADEGATFVVLAVPVQRAEPDPSTT